MCMHERSMDIDQISSSNYVGSLLGSLMRGPIVATAERARRGCCVLHQVTKALNVNHPYDICCLNCFWLLFCSWGLILVSWNSPGNMLLSANLRTCVKLSHSESIVLFKLSAVSGMAGSLLLSCHELNNIPLLGIPCQCTSTLQLQNSRKWCMWLQQHVQEFNVSPQSQMPQHRKRAHGKHTTTVQSQNATTLQWSPKVCQTWQEIGFTRQTLCNPIPWHHGTQIHPSQPTWKNNLQRHLARQPNQSSQNFCYQKLCPVCQRGNCNS